MKKIIADKDKRKVIPFDIELFKVLGGVTDAIYYQQLFYWSDKGKRKDGFRYKTKKEIENETGIKKREQDKIREKLIKKGWLQVRIFKANGVPTCHYRVTMRLPETKWETFSPNKYFYLKEEDEKDEILDKNFGGKEDKIAFPVVPKRANPGKSPNVLTGCPQSALSITENTTENTTEIILEHSKSLTDSSHVLAKFSILPTQSPDVESHLQSEMAISVLDPIEVAMALMNPGEVTTNNEEIKLSKNGYTTEEELDINRVMEPFFFLNKAIRYGNRAYRKAAHTVIKAYGIEDAVALAEMAVKVQGMPYAPVITTPLELQSKIGQLRGFVEKEKNVKKRGGIVVV